MALRIVRAFDPIVIERIILTLYGGPGMRKTTIANTADAPLTLDFDGGIHRARNRKDVVPVARWSDVASMQASDFAGYSTVVVDTAGRAIDKVAVHVIEADPKNARNDGSPSLQGWGAIKVVFANWLERLKSYGLDIVLVLHGSEEKKGDDILERLDVQGSSRGEIHKVSDAMGRVYIAGGQNVLNFSPSDAAFGKNPGNMPPLVFEGPEKQPAFLAGVITEIKRVLNEQSESVRKMREMLDSAKTEFEKFETPEAFTTQAAALVEAKAENAVKLLLMQVATAKGFTYDRQAKAFTKPEPPKAQEGQAGGLEQRVHEEAGPPEARGLFGGQHGPPPDAEFAGAGAGGGRGRSSNGNGRGGSGGGRRRG